MTELGMSDLETAQCIHYTRSTSVCSHKSISPKMPDPTRPTLKSILHASSTPPPSPSSPSPPSKVGFLRHPCAVCHLRLRRLQLSFVTITLFPNRSPCQYSLIWIIHLHMYTYSSKHNSHDICSTCYCIVLHMYYFLKIILAEIMHMTLTSQKKKGLQNQAQEWEPSCARIRESSADNFARAHCCAHSELGTFGIFEFFH